MHFFSLITSEVSSHTHTHTQHNTQHNKTTQVQHPVSLDLLLTRPTVESVSQHPSSIATTDTSQNKPVDEKPHFQNNLRAAAHNNYRKKGKQQKTLSFHNQLSYTLISAITSIPSSSTITTE